MGGLPVLPPEILAHLTPELVDGALLVRSLRSYIRAAWPVIESHPMVWGWHIDAIADHLAAVTQGKIEKLAIMVPPGTSKALALDTQVLTTWGWKRHGDLVVGDQVFAPDGQPTRVEAVTPVFVEEAYEVGFDGGAKITAGAGHLWAVEQDEYEGKRWKRVRIPRVVATPDLFSPRKRGGTGRGARIPLPEPVAFPPQSLLIDPYVFGVWLGDGNRGSGSLTVAQQDVEFFSRLGPARQVSEAGPNRQVIWRVTPEDLTTKLRVLGLLNGERYIPEQYMRGSVEQRIALLQGLMDTDGCGTKQGDATFSTASQRLALQFVELVGSLGMKGILAKERYCVLNGKRYGPHYMIRLFPWQSFPVFRLPRKQARVALAPYSTNPRPRHHYVRSLEPIGPREVSCITVRGGLYLAGRELIPTHNSSCVSVLWPTWEWALDPSQRWLFQSFSQDLALDHALKARNILRSDWYSLRWPNVQIREDQDQKTRYDTTAGGYRVSTVVGGQALGLHPTRVVWDDPNKRDTVASALDRKAVNDSWDQTISTRGAGVGVRRVLVMQRLHEDDAAGHILGREKDWVQLVLPMRYEPKRMVETPIGFNDPRAEPEKTGVDPVLLEPARFPEHVVQALEYTLQSYGAAGQLQQRPAPVGGGLIKRHHLRFWRPVGEDLGPVLDPETGDARMLVERPVVFDQQIQSWDMSFKDEMGQVRKGRPPDPVSGLVLARFLASVYLLDRRNAVMDVLGAAQAVVAMSRKHPDARVRLIEDKANGPAVRAILRKLGVQTQPVTPAGTKLGRVMGESGHEQKSKDARAMSMQAMIEAGEFYLPHPKVAPWVWDYVAQLCSFPTAPHDDDVDATSQGFLYFERFIDHALTQNAEQVVDKGFPKTTNEIVTRAFWEAVEIENAETERLENYDFLDSPSTPWLTN